jgi:hypothetical protein
VSDHLEPEDGAFASGSIDYHLAVRRALAPPKAPTLSMVLLPSFDVERGVFVCTTGRRQPARVVHSGRLTAQLWAAAHEPGRSRQPTSEDFERTRPSARWTSADLAEPAFVAVQAAWDAALLGARWREAPGIGLDGTNFHFASARRSGRVWSPEPGSPCAALVALGEALAQLTELPEHLREEHEHSLEKRAQRMATLFGSRVT